MSTFNRSIPFLALGLCGLLAAGPASAEIKIGVVNFQKLLEDAPQTKAAMQALENEFAPRRRELLTMQNDLKAKDEKLQKEGAVMAEADRAKAGEDAARSAARILAQGRRIPGRRFDARATRRSARCSAISSARSRPTRTRRASIWCWATACSSPSRRSTSRRTCWRCSPPSRRRCRDASERAAPAKPPAPQQVAPRLARRSLRTRMCACEQDFSLGELAVRFGLELRGDPGHCACRSVATLSQAAPGSLSFLANPRYRRQPAGDPGERRGALGAEARRAVRSPR